MTPLADIRDESGKVPKYAWPGGYPVVYVMDDGEVLCADCVNDPSNPVHESGDADGWRVDGYQIHWEGPPEHCAHCNAEIPSAYGDPDEPMRVWESDGFKLELWDAERTDSHGKAIVRYRFTDNGVEIFAGEDFACSPLHAIDSDATVGALLGFLSLQAGDTDAEYFASYTPEQLVWRDARAEDLQLASLDLQELG